MPLSDMLAGDRFLQGWDSARTRGTQEQMQQIQAAGGLMELLQRKQKMEEGVQQKQRDELLRRAVAEAGSPEAAIPLLIKQGPEGIKLAGVLAEATKDLRPKAQEPFTLAPGASRYGPDGKLLVSAPAAPEKQEPTPEYIRLLKIRDSLPAASPMRADIQRRIDVMNKAPGTTIVNPAPVTAASVKDPTSPTGWSHADLRTGKIVTQGAPAPAGSQEGAELAGVKVTAREKAEREMNYPEATKQTNIAIENLNHLSTELRELKDHKGLSGITGTVYGRTPSVSNESMAAQSKYESIVNNIFVNALQSMRNASKTGGAVGNVSDREGDKLEQTLSALSRAQSTEDFKANVKKAIDRLEIAKKNIKDAYDATYEYRAPKSVEWRVVR
jgi:hypothetical protein